MDKGNSLNKKVLIKTYIALFSAIGMIVGLLVSRGLLSFCMVSLGVAALYDVPPKKWLQQCYWLLGVGWVLMYGLSYFWSDDKMTWEILFTVKFPILLLPLAFSFLPAFSIRQLQIFTVSTALILLGCVGYSLSFIMHDVAYYLEQYRIAQVLPVPAGGDYIRFSLTITMFFIWCAYIWPILSKGLKWFIGIIMIILAVYLHILAARTGLVALYMFAAGWGFYMGAKRSKLLGVGIVVAILLTAVLGIMYIPTLKARFGYLSYTYIIYTEGQRNGNYSDMGRVISYNIARQTIAEHPVKGVGAGDMLQSMQQVYTRYYPDVAAQQQLLPHNQFLVVWLGCGILALIIFVVWWLAPVWRIRLDREGFFMLIVWFVLTLPLLVEPMLEVQFGVFVYVFFLLWQMHARKHKTATIIENKF